MYLFLIFFICCHLGALRDLNEAIRTSNGVGKAACQAFTQRAMLHRLNGKIEEAKVRKKLLL